MTPRRDVDRGATLVEYALLLGLVALAILAGAQVLVDSGSDELETRGVTAAARGEQVGVLAPPGVTPTSIPSGGADPLPTIAGGGISEFQSSSTTVKNDKWDATVRIYLQDTEGNPLRGARISGSWDAPGQNQAQCDASGDDGLCIFTLSEINQNTDSVQFSVGSAEYTNPDGTVVVLGLGDGSVEAYKPGVTPPEDEAPPEEQQP